MLTVDEFAGSWIYRSFHNNPKFDAQGNELLLATGDLTVEVGGAGCLSDESEVDDASTELDIGGSEISGRLDFHNGFSIYLTVSGIAKPGEPPTIRFRATGVEGTPTAGWIYDYIGYLAPTWPTGVEQRPAIVGTVIRTVAHAGRGGEVRPAGYVLSFIAVSRDYPAAS